MFKCKACEAYRSQLAQLGATVSDLRELVIKFAQTGATERKDLTDKLVALSHPGVAKILANQPPRQREPGTPPRPNFPGFRPDLRPPAPADHPLLQARLAMGKEIPAQKNG